MSDQPTPAPATLTDEELARLAELASKAKAATLGGHWAPDVGVNEWNPIGDFIKACSPDVYAAILSELRALRVHRARRDEIIGVEMADGTCYTTDGVNRIIADRDKLAAFKAYVHKRLDDMGVPTDPDSPHKAEGCRVGGRLDWVASVIACPFGQAILGYMNDRGRLAGELADLRRMYDLAVADAARMSKRIDAEDGEVDRLAGELAAAREEAFRWCRAYGDAYYALKELNAAAGDEIAEYEPPETTQTVLFLNGRVHSVNGWDVRSPEGGAALASPAPAAPAEDQNRGVWFVAACSGLRYRNRGSAGDVSSIIVDGEHFKIVAPAAPATEAAGGTGEHDCRYILDGICPQCGKVFPAPAGGTGEVAG